MNIVIIVCFCNYLVGKRSAGKLKVITGLATRNCPIKKGDFYPRLLCYPKLVFLSFS